MRVILTLAFAAAAWGQVAGPNPAPVTAGVSPPAPIAAGFYAAGVAALPQSRPEPTAWAAGAIPLSTANGIYAITGQDFVLNSARQVVPVSFAGPMTLLKSYSFGQLFAYGAAGGATATSTTTFAITGGGFLRGTFKSGGKFWWIAGAAQVKNASATQTVLHLGIGANW